MGAKEFLNKLTGGDEDIRRTDFHYLYQTKAYEMAVNFANQNIAVEGVKEQLEVIRNDYAEYDRQIQNVVSAEAVNEKNTYDLWKKWNRRKRIALRVVVISIIPALFLGLRNIFLTLFIQFPALLALLGGAISGTVFKIVEATYEKQYESYVRTIEQRIRNINDAYVSKTNAMKREIDNLYLASLDPTHREIVLMRRDQERQHQERMHMEQQRLNSQRAAEEEQRRTRQAQEELLYIEREREKRYR